MIQNNEHKKQVKLVHNHLDTLHNRCVKCAASPSHKKVKRHWYKAWLWRELQPKWWATINTIDLNRIVSFMTWPQRLLKSFRSLKVGVHYFCTCQSASLNVYNVYSWILFLFTVFCHIKCLNIHNENLLLFNAEVHPYPGSIAKTTKLESHKVTCENSHVFTSSKFYWALQEFIWANFDRKNIKRHQRSW